MSENVNSSNEVTEAVSEPSGLVLIIEPDADVAKMLEVRLARERYDVLIAETGQGGKYMADLHSVDLVLLDRNLPDASSVEMVRHLRSTPSPCEVIVMTVDPTVEIFVEALDAGAFDLVVMPFSNLKLVTAKVRNAVQKVRAERACDELTAELADRPHRADERAAVPMHPDIDPVTGLPNRQIADLRFQSETSRALRYNRPLTVVLISVDRLDAVVQTAGAEAANAALADVAQLIQQQIREVDFLADRQGGEFVLLLPETDKSGGAIVAERIRRTLANTALDSREHREKPSESEGPRRLTASFGLASFPADTMNAALLRQSSESALARAQATGNTVVLFDAATHP